MSLTKIDHQPLSGLGAQVEPAVGVARIAERPAGRVNLNIFFIENSKIL